MGQVTQVDKDTLVTAITIAQSVYDDRVNKTQAQLDAATGALVSALTNFEGKIIKAGDTTALTTAITEATNLYKNMEEGVEIGQNVKGSKATLKEAIDVAQLVVTNSANKTTQQLADAKAALDLAVVAFENSKVTALTGLLNVTVTGTGVDRSNHINLENDETLVLTSSDSTKVAATVSNDPSGTAIVTGVALGGPITITVQVKKDGQVIKAGTFTVTVVPMAITSKMITNFDYSTVNGTQAKLVSKPVTLSDFTGNRKDFTIVIGSDRIPIYVSWALSTDFSKGVSMGSVVESHIQDFYYKKDGANGILNRPIAAFGFEDTFQISAFQPGAASSFTLEGADWSYFFEQSSGLGTDTDTSKNRTFTISDGTTTANIQLTSNFVKIDDLVNHINNRLMNTGVKAQAEKVSAAQFKITSTSSTGNIIIDGVNKADFFE
ncbi:hypothetical protein MKZ08_19150 [Viridibacillus sp. FSL R5-0477]|uniref:Hemolysin-type calcium-binding domain-containing protein n=1 Tax=Viridibacillus arenosi FSL R5-213 TaxID=1227360 RepID=W4F507_9BACL|nr:hypothetical protein [Viridibacillus arenosi]ETT87151.1 hemolysin-type calcium-binding domain-containing protein [Viridibacillus arenosi FSL R5-213]OMC87110.1 hypothetical protein BK137_20865 [Viridibacillus arenosi]